MTVCLLWFLDTTLISCTAGEHDGDDGDDCDDGDDEDYDDDEDNDNAMMVMMQKVEERRRLDDRGLLRFPLPVLPEDDADDDDCGSGDDDDKSKLGKQVIIEYDDA